MANKTVFALLTIASLHAGATDSLLCTGEPYSALIHVGGDDEKETVSDLTLLADKPILTFEQSELKEASVLWLEDKENTNKNRIHAVTVKKKNHKVAIDAQGEKGRLTVNQSHNSVTCDWYR